MGYLGIDIMGSGELAARIDRAVASISPTHVLIAEAEARAQLPVGVTLELDAIHDELARLAVAIRAAARRIASFRISLEPTPMTATSHPAPAPTGAHGSQWRRDRVWNELHQVASHNTYGVSGGIEAVFVEGVRTFELDIHRGAPTDLTPSTWSPTHSLVEIVADHFDHAGGRAEDWRVYHVSGSAGSEYEYLSDGLAAVARLDTRDPLTIFVDNKDAFGGTHTAEQFDRLAWAELGERLYQPHELLARAPGARNLHEALDQAGWPTVEELEGRVILVLTDHIETYPPVGGVAFVAPPPAVTWWSDRPVHVPAENVVFYNADATRIDGDEIMAVRRTNSLLRTYFNSRCGTEPATSESDANFRAVDIEPGDEPCPSAFDAAFDDGARPHSGRPNPESSTRHHGS